MFAVENVRKLFPLLEALEKEQYRFTSEEKQIFYRAAFHRDSFDAVREAAFQAAILEPETGKRQELLRQYAENLPEPPCDDAVQIEGYIFQLQQMCYEKEKATQILEGILKKSGIEKEADSMTSRSGEQKSNFAETGAQQLEKEKRKGQVYKNVREGGNLGNKNEAAKRENQRSR